MLRLADDDRAIGSHAESDDASNVGQCRTVAAGLGKDSQTQRMQPKLSPLVNNRETWIAF
jgi:hypothetical protein